MRRERRIAVVIPALDEEASLGPVLDRVPEWVDDVVVADNGSRDATARVARGRGAEVVHEERRGYGAACAAGVAALAGRLRDADVVVFLDAGGSDDPAEMDRLVDPVLREEAELALGVRRGRDRMPRHQRLGTALVAGLLGRCFGVRVSDLGPYRAIRWETLAGLGMRDRRFGWTAEMQARALRQGRALREVSVGWRPGAGRSTISGTVLGSLRAGRDLCLAVGIQAFAARAERIAAAARARRPGASRRTRVSPRAPAADSTRPRRSPGPPRRSRG